MEKTYDPIVQTTTLSRFRLSQPRPAPDSGRAIVLFREGSPLVTFWPKDRLTVGEARWGNYKTVHYVDVTDHTLEFQWDLPSRGDAFCFHASAILRCKVDDPALVVSENLRSVAQVVEPTVRAEMRRITREFDVLEAAEAEIAITAAMAGLTFKDPIGVAVRLVDVELTLEDEAAEYKREADRRARAAQREAEERARAAAKLEEETNLEVEGARAAARVTEEQKLGEIAAKKREVDFVKGLMEDGAGLVALHVAKNPEEIPAIINMLQQHDLNKLQTFVGGLSKLIDENAIEGHQLEKHGRAFADALLAMLERAQHALGSAPWAPVLPLEASNGHVPEEENDSATESGPEAESVPDDVTDPEDD